MDRTEVIGSVYLSVNFVRTADLHQIFTERHLTIPHHQADLVENLRYYPDSKA